MFGLDKLKEARKKAEEIKDRLESITLEGQSQAGEVKVFCNGNRRITGVDINESILRVREKIDIEVLIMEAVNNAVEQAEKVAEAEMRAIMPNIPGLNL